MKTRDLSPLREPTARMNTGKAIFLFVPFLFLFMSLSCSGYYGRLTVPWRLEDRMTIGKLTAEVNNFLVYYAGPSFSFPSALLFDPKEDGRKIVPDQWVPVKDRTQLHEIVEWLEFSPTFRPTLFTILGPDDKIYGYLYSYKTDVLIKAIGDHTLWVSNIPVPPINYGGVGPARR